LSIKQDTRSWKEVFRMSLLIQVSQRWAKASVLRHCGRSSWQLRLCNNGSFRLCVTQTQPFRCGFRMRARKYRKRARQLFLAAELTSKQQGYDSQFADESHQPSGKTLQFNFPSSISSHATLGRAPWLARVTQPGVRNRTLPRLSCPDTGLVPCR